MASIDADSLMPVFCDFEVTDGTRNGEIFQIGAYCPLSSADNAFSRFILPFGNIDWYVSKKVTKVSIIRGEWGRRQLFDLDKKIHIPSRAPKVGFSEFIKWMLRIKTNLGFTKIALISFGNLELDKECLILNLQSCQLLEEFNNVVQGIYNGAQFVNMNFKELSGQGLDRLYKHLFPADPMFKHHNAAEDAKALGLVMEELRKQKCFHVGQFVSDILHWARDEIEELVTVAIIAVVAEHAKTEIQIRNSLLEASILQLLEDNQVDLMELIGKKADIFNKNDDKVELRKNTELVKFFLDSKRISWSSHLFFDNPDQIKFGQENMEEICAKVGQVSVSGKLVEKDSRVYVDKIGGIVVKREVIEEKLTSPKQHKGETDSKDFDYVSRVNVVVGKRGSMPAYEWSPNGLHCSVTMPVHLTANGTHKDKNVETAKNKARQAAARSMLRRLERDQILTIESSRDDSFTEDLETCLAVRCCLNNLTEPSYELSQVNKSVLPHFNCTVSVIYTATTGGSGETKKKAKQAAAKAILEVLESDKKKKKSNERVKEQVVLCTNLGSGPIYLNYLPKPKPSKETTAVVGEVTRKDSGIGKEEGDEGNQGKLLPGTEVTFSLRVEFKKETSRIKVTNVTKKRS